MIIQKRKLSIFSLFGDFSNHFKPKRFFEKSTDPGIDHYRGCTKCCIGSVRHSKGMVKPHFHISENVQMYIHGDGNGIQLLVNTSIGN